MGGIPPCDEVRAHVCSTKPPLLLTRNPARLDLSEETTTRLNAVIVLHIEKDIPPMTILGEENRRTLCNILENVGVAPQI